MLRAPDRVHVFQTNAPFRASKYMSEGNADYKLKVIIGTSLNAPESVSTHPARERFFTVCEHSYESCQRTEESPRTPDTSTQTTGRQVLLPSVQVCGRQQHRDRVENNSCPTRPESLPRGGCHVHSNFAHLCCATGARIQRRHTSSDACS